MCIKGSNKLFIILTCIVFLGLFVYSIWYLFARYSLESSQPIEIQTEPTVGRWRRVNDGVDNMRSFKDEVNKISSLPYLRGYHKAPSKQGVTVYDANLAYDGLNFYNSGHTTEAGIMDMEGNILHKWTYKFEDIWHAGESDEANPILSQAITPDFNESVSHWRRAYLYENGDILAIYGGVCMIKLDKDSNLLWACKVGGIHHHMHVMDNGDIYTLSRARMTDKKNNDREVIEDFILVINEDGEVMKRYSLLESFVNSSYAYILNKIYKIPGYVELFHTNTLEVFDGRLSHISPLFKKGNVLIAVLFLNTIAVVDLTSNQVVWALDGHEDGLWNGVHEPVLLNNGNILIFDNNLGKIVFRWGHKWILKESKVIEFNPFTKEIVWQYKGNRESPFYSRTCGTNQRLPNGNTLITESDSGRAFEVTKEGKIVWEYVNPHRAGENNELIATLFHVHRISRSYVNWLVLEEQK